MTEYVDATVYCQVEPEFHRYYPAGTDPKVSGAKVTRITQSRPSKPKSGVVLVKLTVRIPAAAFMPLRPEAVVVVPADFTDAVIQVEAGDAHHEENYA